MKLFILIGTTIFAAATGFKMIDKKTLLVLLALYLISVVLEYVFNNLVAKNLNWFLGKALFVFTKLAAILGMLAIIAIKTKLWKVGL